jgi:hypothetical protein
MFLKINSNFIPTQNQETAFTMETVFTVRYELNHIIRRVRKIMKSNYELRHGGPSIRLPVRPHGRTRLP